MKTKTNEWMIVIILLIAIAIVSFFAISVGTSDGFEINVSKENTTETPAETTAIVDHEPVSVERQVYDILINSGISHAGACGILANAQAESDLRSNNMENYYNKKFGVTDEEYTQLSDLEQVDFVNDAVGYGLWQFTYYEFKQVLWDTAKSNGTSISDVETQVETLIKILKTPEFSELLKFLKNTSDPALASEKFMLVFERPAVISTNERHKRGAFAIEFSNNINK